MRTKEIQGNVYVVEERPCEEGCRNCVARHNARLCVSLPCQHGLIWIKQEEENAPRNNTDV